MKNWHIDISIFPNANVLNCRFLCKVQAAAQHNQTRCRLWLGLDCCGLNFLDIIYFVRFGLSSFGFFWYKPIFVLLLAEFNSEPFRKLLVDPIVSILLLLLSSLKSICSEFNFKPFSKSTNLYIIFSKLTNLINTVLNLTCPNSWKCHISIFKILDIF